MDTLYDLLGALPRDDADDLRAAFRRAVKGAHPDLRPGDPQAALKFRQIVRANEILGDQEQRAAYDHLLVLARRERQSVSVHPIAARIHKVASAVIVFAGASIVAVAIYLLFMYASTTWLAPANNADITMRLFPDTPAVDLTDPRWPAGGSSLLAKREIASASGLDISGGAIAPSVTMPPADMVSIAPFNVAAAVEPAPNDARSFRARGISAYRHGDLTGAIAEFDQAIQLDPNFSASYIDRSIVFYRLRQFDRAFADIARAKRIEKDNRAKSAPTMARKPRPDQTRIAHSATPQS